MKKTAEQLQVEELSKFLLGLLEERYGLVSQDVIDRVRSSTAPELECWGKSVLFLKLLEERFGTLSHSVVDRVRSSSLPEIKRWGELLNTAETVEAVFVDG